MRVVFVGASKFGLRCLEKLTHLPDVEVVGIITNPENFTISYRPEGVKNVLHVDFRPVAEQHGIPVWQMSGKMTDPALIHQVQAWTSDFILVAGWYHMVPKSIRAIAPAAGLHASLLPDYSGGAPLVWAMINGETKTGISLFLMDDGVDSGALIGQKEEPIYFEDTIATLYGRIEEAGLALIEEHLPKIARGEAKYTVQDESQRRIMPQRSPEDGLIDWNWSALQIYNFIRAQTKPYPGAFTWFHDQRLFIWSACPVAFSESPNSTGQTGQLVATPDSLLVCCGDGRFLALQTVGFNGEDLDGLSFAQRCSANSTILTNPKVEMLNR